MPTQRREEKRVEEHASAGEREHALAPLFMFFPPLGLPYVNWASQECCLFYLRSSLLSSDLPLTFLCSIFAGFSLPCLLATAILDSCFLFYQLQLLSLEHRESQFGNIKWLKITQHFTINESLTFSVF